MQRIGTTVENFPRPTRSLQTTPIDDTWDGVPYSPNKDCKKCGGGGWIYPMKANGETDFSRVLPCPAKGCLLASIRAFKRGEPFMRAHGITATKQTFDNFKPIPGVTQALKFARDLADGKAKFIWLLVYGGVGNGKTHLCNAIAHTSIERGVPTQMVAAADLFSSLRAGIENHTIENLMREYKDIFLLIIDDWGVEYGTDWEAAKFDELLTSRYATARPTVITTNKDISELPDRIRSRFEDKVMSRCVLNSAPDFRKGR